jgi:2,4-dienoyl-CoA reductase-like NADH-dependent reductase (Old Yellow Enzyme family)
MPDIFDGLTINKLRLDNRFVRSATMDSMALDGIVSEAELRLYSDLGRGGIGLIVSHGLYPTGEGKCSPGQLSAHADSAMSSLTRLVSAVHEQGGKIAAQILHGGWMCSQQVTGMAPVGPSAVIHPRSGARVREMSSGEIWQLVQDYAECARRIVAAGFDGLQLHGAHSWLLSAFPSPATNKRQDEWGGSPEGRARLVREIYRAIRQVVGPDYAVMIKLGLKDYHPAGKSLEEGIVVAALLEQEGFDAIEVSEGLEEDFFHHILPGGVSPYYLSECREARKSLSLPLVLVGGMRTLKDMQAVLDSGVADAVSLCRPFIRDPLLVKGLKDGSAAGSTCTSCNGCLTGMRDGRLICTEP